MRSWAVGLLHVRLDDLDVMDEAVFWESLRVFREEKDADRRHIGELVRGAVLRMFNVQVRKQDRVSDPAKYWPMPWDNSSTERWQKSIDRINSLSDTERESEARALVERLNGQESKD